MTVLRQRARPRLRWVLVGVVRSNIVRLLYCVYAFVSNALCARAPPLKKACARVRVRGRTKVAAYVSVYTYASRYMLHARSRLFGVLQYQRGLRCV